MSTPWRFAASSDAQHLAEWNRELVLEEGHRNRMSVPELRDRMIGFLAGEYRAVIVSDEGRAVGYALYRVEAQLVYLRQFYIIPECRRRGFGRLLVAILREEIWPKAVRLTVEVLSTNRDAISFWRAVGYKDYSVTMEIMPGESTS